MKSTPRQVDVELVQSFEEPCLVFSGVREALRGSRNLATSSLILILNLLLIWSNPLQHPHLPVPMETQC